MLFRQLPEGDRDCGERICFVLTGRSSVNAKNTADTDRVDLFKLAPGIQERKIERRTNRPVFKQPKQRAIPNHLFAVALPLIIKEGINSRSFVRAGFVVDDPSCILIIYKGAVDSCANHLSL